MKSLYVYPNNQNALLTWRRESLGGKDYIVAQGVPLVEGVLNGRFVSADEFGLFVNDWNGVPVVMRHPKENDGSARVPRPDVPVIGTFYNAKLDGKRLVGEYWLEADKLDNPDGETVLARLAAQKPSETSTCYWAESIPSVGNWNGQDFALVDQNIHPDHIALLPDEVGACSIEDGCGMNRNSRQKGGPMSKQNAEHPWHKGRPGEVGGSRSDEGGASSETVNTARSLTTKADQATKRAMKSGKPKDHAAARDAHSKAAEMNFQAYYEIKSEDPEAADGFRRAVFDHERTAEIHNKHADKLQQNAADGSYEGRSQEIYNAFYAAFGSTYVAPAQTSGLYVESTFDNYVICQGAGDKRYKIGYSRGVNGEISFAPQNEWEEIKKVEKYVPVQNVTGLIGRAAALWEEVYRSYIDKDMSEADAAKRAWGAIKAAGWEKNDKGEWVKKNQKDPELLGIAPQELEGLASLAAFVAN